MPNAAQFDADFTVSVTVSQNGRQGTNVVRNDPTATGSFCNVNDGAARLGAFQHARDFSLITKENPANPGETIIGYLTGAPTANPAVPDGQLAPPAPLSIVPQSNSDSLIDVLFVHVGNFLLSPDPKPTLPLSLLQNPVQFIGLAPGSVGPYQVNFALPISPCLPIRPQECTPRRSCGGVATPRGNSSCPLGH